jgi:hypothetical protein
MRIDAKNLPTLVPFHWKDGGKFLSELSRQPDSVPLDALCDKLNSSDSESDLEPDEYENCLTIRCFQTSGSIFYQYSLFCDDIYFFYNSDINIFIIMIILGHKFINSDKKLPKELLRQSVTMKVGQLLVVVADPAAGDNQRFWLGKIMELDMKRDSDISTVDIKIKWYNSATEFGKYKLMGPKDVANINLDSCIYWLDMPEYFVVCLLLILNNIDNI